MAHISPTSWRTIGASPSIRYNPSGATPAATGLRSMRQANSSKIRQPLVCRKSPALRRRSLDLSEESFTRLAHRLRQDGIDAEIDRYQVSSSEGWPRWMAQQVKSADFVLIVATATYAKRFEDEKAKGRGKGAKWAGAIIT